MNGYIAKMVFRIVCGDGRHTPQFDEQLRLILAGSPEEAYHRAHGLGMREEEVFFNQREQLVQWQFISVCELYPFSELTDGAEICSRIVETEDPANYLKFVYARAGQVRFGNREDKMHIA